jgi:hypothetical protein
MSSPIKIPISNEKRLRDNRRVRSNSSLSGFFPTESSVEGVAAYSADIAVGYSQNKKYSSTELRELLNLTRQLRRAKRQLLLKSVESPSCPVDRLRGILLQLSVDTMDEDGFSSLNNASVESLGSME